MCSSFSVGSRTSTGETSRIVRAGIGWDAKTPLPSIAKIQYIAPVIKQRSEFVDKLGWNRIGRAIQKW